MYHQMIGSLMYLTNMRPNICFTMNTLSEFLKYLRHVHLTTAKHILRYLGGTIDYGLKYEVNRKINLGGYVDSYWAGSSINRKSTLGCCFSTGSSMISWFSKKQSCVALSTAEAEYVTTCYASCEAVWLWKLLSDLFDLHMDATCTLWQLELRKVVIESSVPWQFEAYWDQVSLYQGYGAEGSSEAPICCNGGTYSWQRNI